MLNMENGTKIYLMLLGRPWLKYAKANHNWGDSTFTITMGERIVTVSITLKNIVKPSKSPKYVDDAYG